VALPRSASLALWVNACLDGAVGPDDVRDAVKGDDPQHLVVGWPGADGPVDLAALPGRAGPGATVHLALPRPGDLLGLAGPAALTGAALDAGEAVVVVGRHHATGLVPVLDARTVLWQAQDAERPRLVDPREEGRRLRQVLLEATAELVRLDVASWSPDIPDLLMDLHHRPDLDLPPGTDPVAAETLERASLCREIVDLAAQDDGGALTAAEASARTRCLTDLDAAARRALVAVCSASLSAS
jgi:hypothetical protein